LTWKTAVFRTLNEARRIEASRPANGPLWELVVEGYVHQMTIGIRKLVDRHHNSNSITNVVSTLNENVELFTRENYVTHDGLPFDYDPAFERHITSFSGVVSPKAVWVPTTGPEAWDTSKRMHEMFDVLCGTPSPRAREQKMQPCVLTNLLTNLGDDRIRKIRKLANQVHAHADRSASKPGALTVTTFNDLHDALRTIVRVTNFVSSTLLNDAAFGSVVPTPQFDALEALDEPWVRGESLAQLHEYWQKVSDEMDTWAYDSNAGFLPPNDGQAGAGGTHLEGEERQ